MIMMGGGDPSQRPVFIEDKPYRVVWEKAAELGMVACVYLFLGITGPDAISSGGSTERVSAGVGVDAHRYRADRLYARR